MFARRSLFLSSLFLCLPLSLALHFRSAGRAFPGRSSSLIADAPVLIRFYYARGSRCELEIRASERAQLSEPGVSRYVLSRHNREFTSAILGLRLAVSTFLSLSLSLVDRSMKIQPPRLYLILKYERERGFVGREPSFDYIGQSTMNSSSIAFQVTRKTVGRTFLEHMLSDRL